MAWRKLFRVFPFFFAYTICVPARDAALFFLPYATRTYSRVYWAGDLLALLLSLVVVFEVLRHLLASYNFLQSIRMAFFVAGVSAAAIGLLFLFTNESTRTDASLEPIVILERAVRFIQVCLLGFVIVVLRALGLQWQHYAVGIAGGFGVYSALNLIVLESWMHAHILSGQWFVIANSAAYNAAAFIWAFYFLHRRRIQSLAELPEADLTGWNEAVTEHFHRWYRRS